MDPIAAPSDAKVLGNAYLIRGWRDLYSAGIDQLAQELEQAGVHATVFRATQWRELAVALDQQHKRGSRRPLVLIGFSYGADDVLRAAQAMERSGVEIDLAITIDPVTPPEVPGNIRQCVNFYEPNGAWDIFPWLRGVALHAETKDTLLLNQNLRAERTDLLEPDTSHANIAANRRLHQEIVRRVVATLYMMHPARDNAGR